jgi:hypothetical protein
MLRVLRQQQRVRSSLSDGGPRVQALPSRDWSHARPAAAEDGPMLRRAVS